MLIVIYTIMYVLVVSYMCLSQKEIICIYHTNIRCPFYAVQQTRLSDTEFLLVLFVYEGYLLLLC